MGIQLCCCNNDRLLEVQDNGLNPRHDDILRRLRERTNSAASFNIEQSEMHRHRLYSKVGIYHEHVETAARYSGNSDVLKADPGFRGNLYELYKINSDEQQPPLIKTSTARP